MKTPMTATSCWPIANRSTRDRMPGKSGSPSTGTDCRASPPRPHSSKSLSRLYRSRFHGGPKPRPRWRNRSSGCGSDRHSADMPGPGRPPCGPVPPESAAGNGPRNRRPSSAGAPRGLARRLATRRPGQGCYGTVALLNRARFLAFALISPADPVCPHGPSNRRRDKFNFTISVKWSQQ